MPGCVFNFHVYKIRAGSPFSPEGPDIINTAQSGLVRPSPVLLLNPFRMRMRARLRAASAFPGERSARLPPPSSRHKCSPEGDALDGPGFYCGLDITYSESVLLLRVHLRHGVRFRLWCFGFSYRPRASCLRVSFTCAFCWFFAGWFCWLINARTSPDLNNGAGQWAEFDFCV